MSIRMREVSATTVVVEHIRKDLVIGRARMTLLQDEDGRLPYGYVHGVMVNPEYRGRGIATALNRRLIAAAKRLRCYKIVLTSRFDRKEVHALYEKLGYKKHGITFQRDG